MITSSPTRRGINIFADEGAPVVAVNDGVIQEDRRAPPKLGKFIVLEDAYGNRYTYAELGKIVREHRKVVMPTRQGEAGPGRKRGPAAAARALPGRDDESQPTPQGEGAREERRPEPPRPAPTATARSRSARR